MRKLEGEKSEWRVVIQNREKSQMWQKLNCTGIFGFLGKLEDRYQVLFWPNQRIQPVN